MALKVPLHDGRCLFTGSVVVLTTRKTFNWELASSGNPRIMKHFSHKVRNVPSICHLNALNYRGGTSSSPPLPLSGGFFSLVADLTR